MLVPVLALAVAVGLVAWELLAGAHERAAVRQSLRVLGDYDTTDVRQRELMVPLSQRVLRPVGTSLIALGRRLMPVGYMDRVRHKLVVAGRPGADELDRFRAVRVLTVALVPVAFLVFFVLVPLDRQTSFLLFGAAAAGLVLGPDARLNRQMAERQRAIRHRLPDVIDLLTISVEAGLGFDQALERAVNAVPGPLSEEFRRMLGEVRAGADRADAFRALDERTAVPELRSFVLALIQADSFGVPIGRILRNQAHEMRVKRRQLAQEEAQKAPVKLLFPMVLCVFPGLFVVLLGPTMLDYLASRL